MGRENKIKRSLQLANLRHCVNYVLKHLAECAVEGLLCETSDNKYFVLHLMNPSYVVDIPKPKDRLGVKGGNQTAIPCHLCDVEKGNLSSYTRAPRRYWEYIRELISSHIQSKKHTSHPAPPLEEISLKSLSPFIVDFSFAGMHGSVDIYEWFKFEPMHNLSLGIRRMLKECLWNLLSDETRKTSML